MRSFGSIATKKIEDLIRSLRRQYTIIIVTTTCSRLAGRDKVGFMYHGKLVESGDTQQIFHAPPRESLTADYVRGSFG